MPSAGKLKIASTDPVSNWPDADHHRRMAIAYQTASVCLVVLGALWLAWMSVEHQWPLVILNVSYLAAGIFLWWRIRTGEFVAAAAGVHAFLFLVIVQICLIYDVPSQAAPRVTHLYFLAMAFLFYVTFRSINLTVTYIAVLIYLFCFIVFSSTTFVVPFADPLPDHLRVVGAWVHSVVAVAIMCASVYIMQADFATRSRLGRQLTAALADNQFELFFQPKVNHESEVLGAEALLRWRHPKRGMVPPGEFIPAAEQLGLMKLIGKWVLEVACAKLAVWQQQPERRHLKIAVNVSPLQFRDDNFVNDVIEIVQRHRIDPGLLELELTESIVVDDLEGIIAKMNELKTFGVSLSLDDFGTGYSSLQYLKRMPFSQVKIDQSFVRDMLTDEKDAVIVKGIIQLGLELGLSVIAEGVETLPQKEFLIENGCLEFQGYLFGRPQPSAEFEAMLNERAAAAHQDGNQ